MTGSGETMELLKIDLSFLRLFGYTTFRAASAALTSLFFSFYLGPKLIRFLRAKKLNQPIRELGPETHHSKKGTPTMGGLLIIFSVVISVLLWCRLDNNYIWIMLMAIVGFGFIGFLDDYTKLIRKNSDGISAKTKLVAQFIVSAIVIFELYRYNVVIKGETMPLYVPFIVEPIINDLGWYIFLPFGIFLVVGFSNAVNLTDGLDGLAIGLLLFVGLTFAILSYISGHLKFAEYLNIAYISGGSEISVYLAGLIGAGLGFLWFNCHPAQVFMGDTGSLSLGGILGVLSLMLKKELLLVIIGGLFVFEAMSVMLQVGSYKLTRKRIFKMAPVHHHFEMSGWHENKVIIRFWIIGAILSLVALFTLKIQ